MYSVKMIFRCFVNDIPSDRYEETILMIDADTAEEIYKKADEYAQSYSEGYEGGCGDKIEWRFVGRYGLPFEVMKERNGVAEVYSQYFDKEENDLKMIVDL